MARLPALADRAERLLGTAVAATSSVAGGDICAAARLRLSDGRSAFVKTRAGAPAGFFRAEARGLAWLAEAGGAPVPEVLGLDEECLVVAWVEPARPSREAAEDLGRGLAETHRAGAETFGLPGGEPGFIGALPMRNEPVPTWAELYAAHRLLPYVRLALDRGAMGAEDAAAVEGVARRLARLGGPEEPPARLHGDLWAGNVVWASDGRAWLVDPAAHGGHRETDLAMLALFGLPGLQRVLAAYHEAFPLADGWRERVPLHQLFPLLVHAAHGFGASYAVRAGELARKLL